eukprot:c20625_g1_i2 orf=384-1889(-)
MFARCTGMWATRICVLFAFLCAGVCWVDCALFWSGGVLRGAKFGLRFGFRCLLERSFNCMAGGGRTVDPPGCNEMDTDFHVDLINQSHGPQGAFVAESISLSKPRVGASTNDQRFLLVFVFGNFFGPDVRNEVPRRSALQRLAMRLPAYTSDQLGGSVFKLSEIESIYYYVLRNAHPSAKVKLQSLYKFLQGHLAPPVKETLEDDRQFTTFFPPHLHRQSRYKGTYKVVESIVFISDPDVSYIRPEDLERFKRLTGVVDLTVNANDARTFQHGQRTDRDEERQARCHSESHGHAQDTRHFGFLMGDDPRKKRRGNPIDLLPLPLQALSPEEEQRSQWTSSPKIGAAMLLLTSAPTLEQWNNIVNAAKPAIVFTGTAAARQSGPIVGAVDIGVCEDAYFFRAALPGVKKDEGEFSCYVESDGKVVIKGTTTTGEPQVYKNDRVFQIQTQFLCPPGPFTISFQLPGPVEPCQFPGTFGSDGVFEAVVMKQRARSGSACLTFES